MSCRERTGDVLLNPRVLMILNPGSTRKIHPLEVAQSLVKIAARRLLDGQHVHTLHREGTLLLTLIDARPHHLSLLHENGVGLQFGPDLIRRVPHVDGQGGVADEADIQPHGKRRHLQPEPTVKVGAGARVAPLDEDTRRKHRITSFSVNDLTANDRLGICGE